MAHLTGECPPAAARLATELMNQVIDSIEKEQQKNDAKPFSVGDSVRVHTRVVEGDKERIQIFAGIVIGRKGRGLNETFIGGNTPNVASAVTPVSRSSRLSMSLRI